MSELITTKTQAVAIGLCAGIFLTSVCWFALTIYSFDRYNRWKL